MNISQLWLSGDLEWRKKSVEQWVTAAGSGKLTDGSATAREYRELLSVVDFATLRRFAEECLTSKAPFAGLALQDVINAIGARLGFAVEYGIYQGTSKNIGFDGLWQADGNHIVVEIKTTDAFRITLDRAGDYLNRLVAERGLDRETFSILYVVGRFDTGDLEAQIRGSRLAWTARMISVDALCRLLSVTATLGDPEDRKKVYKVLRPFEYTKVDDIVDLVFTAAESPEKPLDETPQEEPDEESAGASPSTFNAECAKKIGDTLAKPLVEKSRSQYASADGSTNVVVAVSKAYQQKTYEFFWYAFHPYYETFLKQSQKGFMCFGCGSPEDIIVIPIDIFLPILPNLHQTIQEQRYYYHVRIVKDNSKFVLRGRKGFTLDLTPYRI